MKHNRRTLATSVLKSCWALLPHASLPVCALILVCWPRSSSGNYVLPHPKCPGRFSPFVSSCSFLVFVAYLFLTHRFSGEILPFSERAELGRPTGTADCLQKIWRTKQRCQSKALENERPQEAPDPGPSLTWVDNLTTSSQSQVHHSSARGSKISSSETPTAWVVADAPYVSRA